MSGFDEDPSARPLKHFGKGAAVRLHDRDAGGHRLEQEDALRLFIRGGHREHVEALEKRDLLRAIDLPAILELAFQAITPKARLDVVEILLVLGREIACRNQSRPADPWASCEVGGRRRRAGCRPFSGAIRAR